jgi:DNA-binding NtrC family response regulator
METSPNFPQPDQSSTVLAVNLIDIDCISLSRILSGSRWVVKKVDNCRQALTCSGEAPVSVVLCEARMPDGSWDTLMDGLRDRPAPPALIVASRMADERLWGEVLNLGGYDVLATPFDRTEVLRALFLAWSTRERTSLGKRMVNHPSVAGGGAFAVAGLGSSAG